MAIVKRAATIAILTQTHQEIKSQLGRLAEEISVCCAYDYPWPGHPPPDKNFRENLTRPSPETLITWQHQVTHELRAGPNYLPNCHSPAAAPRRRARTRKQLSAEISVIQAWSAGYPVPQQAALRYVRLIDRAREHYKNLQFGHALQDLEEALAACQSLEFCYPTSGPRDCPGAFTRPVVYWAQNLVLAKRKNYPAAARAARRILTVENKHFSGRQLKHLPGYLKILAEAVDN